MHISVCDAPYMGCALGYVQSMWDLLLTNCHAATMAGPEPYGAVRDAAIGIKDGRIVWVGPRASATETAREKRDLGGAWVTPGLIDCHTHLVFGGNRAGEWEARLNGASYEDIARKGGGIVSTVKATRAASEDELVGSATSRLQSLTRQGVTTVEIKSGYGLDLETEKKMLRAAGRLKGARVVRSFLGAHALPPEFAQRRKAYVDLVCDEMIPAIAREHLADAVDAFCETIGFTRDETERVFKAAAAHNLKVKLHAEQLSDSRGAELACRYGALSADHLEHLTDAGIAAMAKAGTVAVLLPSAFYFLRDTKLPPVDTLRRAGVPIAVATDCNPGTSPNMSPLLAMNMALFPSPPLPPPPPPPPTPPRARGPPGSPPPPGGRGPPPPGVAPFRPPRGLSFWGGPGLTAPRSFAGPPPPPPPPPENVRSIRAPRGSGTHLLDLGRRGRDAHVDEQSRPRGRRAARGPRRLWRHRQGGAQLGSVRPHRRQSEIPEARRNLAGAIGQAGRRIFARTPTRRAC